MFHRLTLALVTALSLAACVDDPGDLAAPTAADRASTVTVEVPQSRAPGDQRFALTPNAICGATYCGPRPPWTTCYCYAGSGLWYGSTCSQGCRDSQE